MTTTRTIGHSKTGMTHRVYKTKGATGTAACSTGGNLKQTYVFRIREATEEQLAIETLCKKCFPGSR